jgi:hypothetical protein
MSLEDQEHQLITLIEMIRRDYQKQIDPLIKQLSFIRSLRPMPPIAIWADQDRVMFQTELEDDPDDE